MRDQRVPEAGPAKTPSRKLRIFHCDDSAAYRRLLVEMFSAQPDLDVIGGAGTLTEAAEAIARSQPDVVLLDIFMPGNDLAMLNQLRTVSPASRLVVLSGADSRSSPIIAAADDYLRKSESFDSIAAALRRAVPRKS